LLGDPDGVERLRHGADLVELHEDRIGEAGLDALLEALRVRDEEVVADELDLVAELVREELPALFVVLGAAVFDADEGELGGPRLPDLDELLARLFLLVEGVALLLRVVELDFRRSWPL
jgi:hypothetical protein